MIAIGTKKSNKDIAEQKISIARLKKEYIGLASTVPRFST
jgi:hypothetical protein